MEVFETYNYKNYKIVVGYDEYAQDPRDDSANVATFVVNVPRYMLGDRQDVEDAINDLFYEVVDDDDTPEPLDLDDEWRMCRQSDKVLILPISLYDHSGLEIYIGDPADNWDSCRVGFAYITKADALSEGATEENWREWARREMELEMEVYSQWVNGECFGYTVYGPAGEEVTSLYGFYGTDHEASGLMDNAREAVGADIERKERDACDFWSGDNAA